MCSEHFIARGCRDLVESRSDNVERRTLVQQVRLDAVCHGYFDVQVQRDRFGDGFLSPLVEARRRQEPLSSECALHGEALRADGAEPTAGAGEAKVVECRSDKQQLLVEAMLPLASE